MGLENLEVHKSAVAGGIHACITTSRQNLNFLRGGAWHGDINDGQSSRQGNSIGCNRLVPFPVCSQIVGFGVICRTRHLISTLKTRSVWAGTLDLAEARDRLGRTKLVIVGSVFTDKILVTRNSFTIANLLGEDRKSVV